MNYVEVAIPFFILAMLVEYLYGKLVKRQTYRLADTGNTLQSAVSFAATAGTTYYIAVDGHGGATRSINIIPAGEVFIQRLNQIDLRFAKLFRLAGTRTSINFDFYNVTNSNSVLTENATFGAAYRTPQSILLPRLFKLRAQFDF